MTRISSAKSALPLTASETDGWNALKLLGAGDEQMLLDAVALCEDIGAQARLASEDERHAPQRSERFGADLGICRTLETMR